MGDSCETCGARVQVPGGVHLCGTCAEDWNDRDVAAGLRRINKRRARVGLEPITRDAVKDNPEDAAHKGGQEGRAHMESSMTQARWDSMTPAERDEVRSDAGLSPQLVGLEGWRVEVTTTYGETRRFIVGRSSGWVPCHIELARRDSRSGIGADREYVTVRPLYRAR